MGKTRQFLTDVEAAIGNSVPAERRAEILAETYAHLEDRAEDLAFGGAMAQEKAEEEALSAFGGAKTYARGIAESFYEDGPRSKVRKLAFWTALLCVVLPIMIRTFVQNPQYQTDLSYRAAVMLYQLDVVCWVTLSVIGSLILGFLGRKCQTKKISLVFLCFLTVCFVYVGRRDVLSDDKQLLYARAELPHRLAQAANPESYLYDHYLIPLEEAQRAFTSSAPISARWRLPDGTFPVPAPREVKRSELAFSRSQGNLLSAYSVRSEEEARQHWQQDGSVAVLKVRRLYQRVEEGRKHSLVSGQAMLEKPFHPLAACVQLTESVALWLLVILCDVLGVTLGRWVHRRTWKKKPSIPRKGATA